MAALQRGLITPFKIQRRLEHQRLIFDPPAYKRIDKWICSSLRLFMRGCELSAYMYVWDRYRLLELPWDSAWTWWFTFLGVDFCFYWVHRSAHGTSTHTDARGPQKTDRVSWLISRVYWIFFTLFMFLLAVVVLPSVRCRVVSVLFIT